MTSNELAIRETSTDLGVQMDYAKAVSSASMLPENYRNKPADIMLAVGLGQSMGLSPAESLYRISVIKGKPTASAELIAANVRKAGHRLRVVGDDKTCTATIIRADDPDFEFSVTRDIAWAEQMGLSKNDNYRKQPGTMLQWRAITACARLAAPEALYGVQYTPDEMGDFGPSSGSRPASGGLGAALGNQAAEPEIPTVIQSTTETPESDASETGEAITKPQLSKLQILLKECGITDRDEALSYYQRVTGHPVDSSKALTKNEAGQVIDDLERAKAGEPNLLDGDQ